MRLHADASVKRQLVIGVRERGIEVTSQLDLDPAASDAEVLDAANVRDAVLLTEDKDFGDLVFRDRLYARGVILVRAGVVDALSLQRIVEAVVAALPVAEGMFTTISGKSVRRRAIIAG